MPWRASRVLHAVAGHRTTGTEPARLFVLAYALPVAAAAAYCDLPPIMTRRRVASLTVRQLLHVPDKWNSLTAVGGSRAAMHALHEADSHVTLVRSYETATASPYFARRLPGLEPADTSNGKGTRCAPMKGDCFALGTMAASELSIGMGGGVNSDANPWSSPPSHCFPLKAGAGAAASARVMANIYVTIITCAAHPRSRLADGLLLGEARDATKFSTHGEHLSLVDSSSTS